MKNLNEKRPSGLALLPFAMFIVIYMGAGIYYQVKGMEMAFYQFPSVTAMFLAVLAALAVIVVRAVRKKKPLGRLGKKKNKLPAGEEPKSEE